MSLSLFDKIKLLTRLNATVNAVEDGIAMKNSTKIVSAIVALLVAVVQNQTVQTAVLAFVASHPGVSAAIAGLSTILALLHIPVNDAAKVIVLAILLSGSTMQAQTAVFTASSDAVAFHYNGEWTPATLVSQQFDLLDFGAKKTNHISLIGNQFVAPGAGFNAYLGGVRFDPDLTRVLSKTNVPAGSFGLYLEGSAGNGVPSAGGSHISFLAGGGVKYRATASLSWNALRAQYVRFGSQQGVVLSSGLSFIFGSK